jgi:hypothetical protein
LDLTSDPINNVFNCNFGFYAFKWPDDDSVMVETRSNIFVEYNKLVLSMAIGNCFDTVHSEKSHLTAVPPLKQLCQFSSASLRY